MRRTVGSSPITASKLFATSSSHRLPITRKVKEKKKKIIASVEISYSCVGMTYSLNKVKRNTRL